MWSKLKKFISREYLTFVPEAGIKNITDFFAVPKGEQDIRMVFNGTRSGLTDTIWAPSYWLPNATSILRTISFGHRAVDIELGEFFINLPLHDDLKQLSAVDLTQFRTEIIRDFPAMSHQHHRWYKFM